MLKSLDRLAKSCGQVRKSRHPKQAHLGQDEMGNEDLAEIRARLTSNMSMLTAFIISTTQARVETKLDKLIQEFCRGNREPPTVSFQTVDSLSADDRAVWRNIRKELERIGISLAVFDANRNFIFDWFIHAVETGAFEEQRVHVIINESNCNDGRKPLSREEHGDHETGRQIEHAHIGSLGSTNEEKAPARQRSSQSAHDLDLSPPRPGPKTFDYVFASTQTTPKDKRRVPRAAAPLAEMSRPRQRLIKAVETKDVSKALKILNDKASFHLLDIKTLDRALLKDSRQNNYPSLYLIVSELIARDDNVDYISSDTNKRTPLWNYVDTGCFDTVRILVDNEADVNYTGSDRIPVSGS